MRAAGAVLAAEGRSATRCIGRIARGRSTVCNNILAVGTRLAVRIAAVLMPIVGAVILAISRRGRRGLARGNRRRERQRRGAKQEDLRFHSAFSLVMPPESARTGADMMRTRSGGRRRCPPSARGFSPGLE